MSKFQQVLTKIDEVFFYLAAFRNKFRRLHKRQYRYLNDIEGISYEHGSITSAFWSSSLTSLTDKQINELNNNFKLRNALYEPLSG